MAPDLKKWGWERKGQSSQNNRNSVYQGRQMWEKYMLKENANKMAELRGHGRKV